MDKNKNRTNLLASGRKRLGTDVEELKKQHTDLKTSCDEKKKRNFSGKKVDNASNSASGTGGGDRFACLPLGPTLSLSHSLLCPTMLHDRK